MRVPFNMFPIKWDKVSKTSQSKHSKDPWRSYYHFRRDRIRVMCSKAHPGFYMENTLQRTKWKSRDKLEGNCGLLGEGE